MFSLKGRNTRAAAKHSNCSTKSTKHDFSHIKLISMSPMKSKYLFMLFFATLLTACHVHTDGGTTTIFSFENKSNHTIELFRIVSEPVEDGEIAVADATLPPGEQVKYYFGGGIGATTTSAYLEMYKYDPVIVFGSRYQVRLGDKNLPLNLQKEQTENEKKRWVKYKYTITDADYEYAVANGVVIGEWHSIGR